MSGETETVVLAGGCYWIMQQLLRERDGVISTRAGSTGGENENPTEENNSGHAEAVEVVFDPERVSYRELLEYFFMVHRPDLGGDVVGSGYRSEIFYTTESSAGGRGDALPRRRRLGPLARQGRDRDHRGRPLLGGRARGAGPLPALSGRLRAHLSAAGAEAANPGRDPSSSRLSIEW